VADLRTVNLETCAVGFDEGDPDGYHTAYARLGPMLRGALLGGSLYELPPGQSICPYHYEWGNEEWLLVVAGRVVVRHPDGENVLEPGELVCFPVGPEGAHKATNREETAARVLILSTKIDPAASVYPDSGKIGIWPAPGSEDAIIVRQSSKVDYWDGELGSAGAEPS